MEVTVLRRLFSRGAGVGLIIGFLIAGLPILADGGTVTDFSAQIPRKIGGWEASGKDRIFSRQTLYDYMDGGAEVYLAFDFREVWARKYSGSAGREMTLDIYDMGSPEEAFGAFSCERQDPGGGIGQESEYGAGLLRFWQGRYFVTVTASSDDAAVAVLELGKAAARLLGPPGAKPGMVAFLPAESLRPERTSYFHSAVNLNNRFFVSGENILRLDGTTDCVFAEYGAPDAEPVCLLLIRYADAGRASSARQSFLASYLPEADAEGLARTENKKWASASVRGNYLAAVFDAPSPDIAKKLAASVKFTAK
jgi:hypothetical protein